MLPGIEVVAPTSSTCVPPFQRTRWIDARAGAGLLHARRMTNAPVLLTRDSRDVYDALWDLACPLGGRRVTVNFRISPFLRELRGLSISTADRTTQLVKLELRQTRLIAVVAPRSSLVQVIGTDPHTWP